MRLRNNPNAKNILENSKYVIQNKQAKYFNNDLPVHIEIGMGKGDFIVGMAKKYPEINFIGVEKYASVLVKALEKIELEQLDNVLILEEDALNLLDYFSNKSISTIYINFSDPWPKKGHYKRRLSYEKFLDIYKLLLNKDGLLIQKTDNVSLFESSLLSYHKYQADIQVISLDLHKSKYQKDNVMSEYEKKFSGLGQPIFMAQVSLNKGGK